MDHIDLTGLRFTAFHGCLDFERKQGQEFIVDARLYLNLQPAGTTDDLDQTVNYAAVWEDIRDIVCGEPQNLLESVAEKIADRLLAKYPLEKVKITVHKPQAPMPGPFADVSVCIRRNKP